MHTVPLFLKLIQSIEVLGIYLRKFATLRIVVHSWKTVMMADELSITENNLI